MNTKKGLDTVIDQFASGQISGCEFEKRFSAIFDFEEYEISQKELGYYESIRNLLERFSPFEADMKKHSDYFITEKQLRHQILNISKSNSI